MLCVVGPQVFRPGFNQPTRTLAEQADIEIADARRREEVGGWWGRGGKVGEQGPGGTGDWAC